MTRLWIVLIPALVATVLVDRVSLHSHPEIAAGTYFPQWSSGPSPDGSYSTSASTFVGNAFFVQTILTPTYGTNVPLWSLAYEFWYYILFPLCFIGLGYSAYAENRSVRAAASVIVLLLYLEMSDEMRLGFLVWMMGVVVYLITEGTAGPPRPWVVAASLLAFLGAVAYSKAGRLQAVLLVPADVVVGAGFSFLCVVLARIPRINLPAVGSAADKAAYVLSEMSYSLYLSHFPFVVLIAALVYVPYAMPPVSRSLVIYFFWLGALLVIGLAFWIGFERHTKKIRRAITAYTGI
jgi:peptidoglycan/LPS O-acetylase OafA/YrhL